MDYIIFNFVSYLVIFLFIVVLFLPIFLAAFLDMEMGIWHQLGWFIGLFLIYRIIYHISILIKNTDSTVITDKSLENQSESQIIASENSLNIKSRSFWLLAIYYYVGLIFMLLVHPILNFDLSLIAGIFGLLGLFIAPFLYPKRDKKRSTNIKIFIGTLVGFLIIFFVFFSVCSPDGSILSRSIYTRSKTNVAFVSETRPDRFKSVDFERPTDWDKNYSRSGEDHIWFEPAPDSNVCIHLYHFYASASSKKDENIRYVKNKIADITKASSTIYKVIKLNGIKSLVGEGTVYTEEIRQKYLIYIISTDKYHYFVELIPYVKKADNAPYIKDEEALILSFKS